MGGQSVSNKLFWQPSDCITIFFMNDIVAVGNKYDDDDDHRLNGSSSPVLTATCLSYGSLCDYFSPTWRSHPSTDFDAKWLKRRGFMYTCAF